MVTEWIVAISSIVATLGVIVGIIFYFLHWVRQGIKDESESIKEKVMLEVERIQSDFRAVASEVKADILMEVTRQMTHVADQAAKSAAEQVAEQVAMQAAKSAAEQVAEQVATKAAEEALRKYIAHKESSN